MGWRNKFVFLGFSMVSTAAHFAIFILAYNRLATPFLPEAQRVENAGYILFYVLPAMFVVSSSLFSLAYYKKHKT